jgi:hypothetical protein
MVVVKNDGIERPGIGSPAMISQTCPSFGPTRAMPSLPRFLSRHAAALAVGWLAYGLFYLSVAAVFIGLPVALVLYLLGVLPG